MGTQLPIELLSNLISIGLIGYLFYRYFQYKKKLDVIKGLDELKEQNSLTADDLEFIKQNEKEYKQKLIKSEYNLQVATPAFILAGGALVLLLPFAEAAIHLNVVVVAFIVMQIDKLHKKNIHGFLHQLKQDTKEEEPKE